MSDIFIAGGWFMWPLLACSITIISISIERFWMLQERLVSPSGLNKQVLNLIDRDLLITVHKYKELSRDLLESKLEEKSIEIKYKLERNLSMLGVVSTISPLLGLLGTVVGMITVFSTFQSSGAASPDLLASGISQALITTAFGLMIAVPGLILHRHFEQKVNKLMILLQSKTSSFIDNF